jgi:hypothetical protein
LTGSTAQRVVLVRRHATREQPIEESAEEHERQRDDRSPEEGQS